MLVNAMSIPAIQDLIKKSFVTEVHQKNAEIRRVFMKETGSFESSSKRIHEFDRERFGETKVEGQSSAQRGVAQGYFKDIERKTISVTRVVTGEAYMALTAQKLSEYTIQTKKDIVDKIELDMRNYLGYATLATSYTDNGGFLVDLTVGDGNAVFHTAHTLRNSSLTYSNILSGAPVLSDVSLQSAEDYFEYNVMDNFGQQIEMSPDTIITTRKAIMVNRVARLFQSMSPDSINAAANANSGVKNVYKNKYTHLQIRFDVDSNGRSLSTYTFHWMLASLSGTPEERFQAYYVSWLSPMVAPAEVDQDKWIMSYTARACYGIGAVSGKGILVSKATA